MNKSESLNELMTALSAFQADISNVAKSADNPFFKSKYADLSAIWNEIRPHLEKHGLSFVQFPSNADGMISVETIVGHKSGQWMSGTVSAPLGGKKDAQATGSVITYLRRYSLASVAGLAQEDDDGNAATAKEDHSAVVLKYMESTSDQQNAMWPTLSPQQQSAITQAFNQQGA